MFKFFKAFVSGKVSTFHKLNVHSGLMIYIVHNFVSCISVPKGLKPSDIANFFSSVNEQANRIKENFGNSKNIPQVTVCFIIVVKQRYEFFSGLSR